MRPGIRFRRAFAPVPVQSACRSHQESFPTSMGRLGAKVMLPAGQQLARRGDRQHDQHRDGSMERSLHRNDSTLPCVHSMQLLSSCCLHGKVRLRRLLTYDMIHRGMQHDQHRSRHCIMWPSFTLVMFRAQSGQLRGRVRGFACHVPLRPCHAPMR